MSSITSTSEDEVLEVVVELVVLLFTVFADDVVLLVVVDAIVLVAVVLFVDEDVVVDVLPHPTNPIDMIRDTDIMKSFFC